MSIYNRFLYHVITCPKATAIHFQNQNITYADLSKITEKIAEMISVKMLGENKPIAIMLNRTPDLLASVLAAFRLKTPCVLIDPSYPNERRERIIEESGAGILLYQSEEDVSQSIAIQFLCPNKNIEVDGIGYIIFTSGSTGKPKGVLTPETGIQNLIDAFIERFQFIPGDIIACMSTPSFDMFFVETILALCLGMTVALADESDLVTSKRMSSFLNQNEITVLHITASRMQMLLFQDPELNSLKKTHTIIVGAEPVPFSLVKELQRNTKARIFNGYGPSEASVWTTFGDLTKSDNVHIGTPITGTEVYILDKQLNRLPIGEVGEIFIAGKGLAKGYLDPIQTTERFVFDLIQPEKRIYRTGDLGRILPDGNIEILGRLDNQVKIRGYRVELEEIEKVANEYKKTLKTIASISENSIGQILCLHYLANEIIDIADFKHYLAEKLPPYAVPDKFILEKEFMYTLSGKIDRKAFKDQEVGITEKNSLDEITDVENVVRDVLSQLTNKSNVMVPAEKELVSLGIDSLAFVRMVVMIENDLNVEFEDDMGFFALPTIKAVVEYATKKVEEKEKICN